MDLTTRAEQADFAGHEISYRVAGAGPALALVKPHNRPRVSELMRLLAGHYTVFQIEPLGFGSSDRPSEYPGGRVHEQVLAVLDREGVDEFAVWGYSQGGAMSAAVAQASRRVSAMVVGGWSPTGGPTDAWMRRADREKRIPVASRAFWHWYRRFDWMKEMAAIPCPKLVYFGSEDGPRVRGREASRAPVPLSSSEVSALWSSRAWTIEPVTANQPCPRVLFRPWSTGSGTDSASR